ncbi:8590_t:CDS:2 [Acaulospora morrowiae]|uniref:8590_t:CDS:1 n=1 Tax=Acaulospora morrowiae TaxID=94023 RepID=A0A9N9EN42_9GLOM|nr:8590_t:CDS:2 [Acaulospora morrowiae]
MKINEKSTSVIITANGTRERTLRKVKEFQRENARIHFDERKILLRYRGEKLEVPISHNGIEGLAQPDELEVSDDESEDTFDELKYESKNIEEKEGYYTGQRSKKKETMDKGIPSPAVYLTVLEEISTLEDDEKYEDEKLRVDLIGLTEEDEKTQQNFSREKKDNLPKS